MKRLVFDLDGALPHDDRSVGYAERRPNLVMVERLRADGFYIDVGHAEIRAILAGEA